MSKSELDELAAKLKKLSGEPDTPAPTASKAKPAARKGKTGPKPGNKKGFEFPRGNKWWQVRAKHGRNGKWDSPQKLLEDCLGYFEWLDENPLFEDKGFAYQGEIAHDNFIKMRAATLHGLLIHLGIVRDTWYRYRDNPDFSPVCDYIESLIYEQKFTGAAAGLLNPAIIARDLGLKDNVQNEVSGPGGGPVETITADMDPVRAAQLYKEMICGGR